MNVHVVSLVLMALMFVVASVWQVNLGVLALVAAFLIGAGLQGLDADAIVAGFPGDLFILLVGVTYLFGIARQNGSLERLVQLGMRVTGNRDAALPWLMFALTTMVAASGALSAAAVAIVSPVAMRIAEQHRINPLLMGLMVVQGATAGSFSPLSPFGAITNRLLTSSSLPPQQGALFFNTFVFNLVLAVVVFAVFGGRHLLVKRETAEVHAMAASGTRESTASTAPSSAVDSPDSDEAAGGSPAEQVVTLVGIVVLLASATLFGLDVGFTALTIGLVLTAFRPSHYSETIKSLPWAAVLLVCGVITYVGVLDEIGTIDYLRELVTTGGNPLLTALAAAYVGGIISAFASTAGVLGASIPLTIPLLEQGVLPLTGTITAVAIASSVVDVSPMSTNGALLVANQRTMDSRAFFQRLLAWAVVVILLAPLLSWLIYVVL